VVLCAYLGQLAKVRDALATEITLVIDERDQIALADHDADMDEEVDVGIERVKVSKKARFLRLDI
jgi:hypothetical protein